MPSGPGALPLGRQRIAPRTSSSVTRLDTGIGSRYAACLMSCRSAWAGGRKNFPARMRALASCAS
jgi:phage-related minor tail protein